MSVLLVGANPGVTLFDEAGRPTAFASLWRVDWSVQGTGSVLVLVVPGSVRVVSADERLARWLCTDYVAHFPEVAELGWDDPVLTTADVRVTVDLATGAHGIGADLDVRLTDPMDRRRIHVPRFELGGSSQELSNVFAPCTHGQITVAGRPLAGRPRVSQQPRPSSSAYLADAEVWSTA